MHEFIRLTKLPQMCGAIDGTHIKLLNKPKRAYQPTYYWCRHDAHMKLLQGICDHDDSS